MTEQLEGPELWLRVAQVMGAADFQLDPEDPSRVIVEWLDGYDWEHFNPDTNDADAWAMLEFAKTARTDHKGNIITWPCIDSDGTHWCVITTMDDEFSGGGPTDAIALGRAIVEAWG